MKILHVETGRHLYGGARQVLWLLRGLREAGVDNVLVCPPGSGIDAAARRERLRVLNLECSGDADLVFAWRLAKLLPRERPDLLHSHSRRGADVLGGLAARRARVPAIVSRRVDHPESKLAARLRYRPFDRIVAISGQVADVLRASGVDPDRVSVIRSAVDVEPFRTPPERAALARAFGLAGDTMAIAAAGQLIPRKGHAYLLEAMSLLARRLPAAHLVIFGQGSLEDDLKRRAAALGLADRVQFAGFRGDLDRYLGAFDLLVHPALCEGLGVVMLEAAAAGVPVIAFAVAGSREAVADGETGLLVTPKDPGALADAVSKLAGDPARRKRYGEAGRERVRREFSIDAMVNGHIRLYEAVLHATD